MKDLFEHAFQNLSNSNIVGIRIQNRVNQNDNAIGMSFRRKGQLAEEVIWRIFESPSRTLDSTHWPLIETIHSTRIPEGFSKRAIKSKVRPLKS